MNLYGQPLPSTPHEQRNGREPVRRNVTKNPLVGKPLHVAEKCIVFGNGGYMLVKNMAGKKLKNECRGDPDSELKVVVVADNGKVWRVL